MTPELVKAVVDDLFAYLEAKFASKALITIALHALQVAADDAVPAIFARLQAPAAK